MAAERIQSLEVTGPYEPPAPAHDAWKLPGERYLIVGEIARGGMGVVLRVHDTSLDRPLAIKVLLPRPTPVADDERRFLEEASITGQLQHPGIPPVHEVGRLADKRPFFSMKLIEGRTLSELLRQRATPQTELPRLLKIFEQIAETLAYAHSRGIIHRDLKPHNIMVGAFGEVQVMDWGLAKRLAGQRPAASPAAVAPSATFDFSGATAETVAAGHDTDASHTQAGEVLGTLAYMSPEQARGDVAALDERCDVFGLGAILCTILTGQPPYLGKDRQALWAQARDADLAGARERLAACGADADLVRLAQSCLSPAKEERPRDAGEVAEAVAGYLASVQERLQQARVAGAQAEVQAREERKRRHLAVGLAGAVLLLVVGAAAAGMWYVHDQGQRAVETATRGAYVGREVTAALDEAQRQRKQLHDQLRDQKQAAQLLSDLNLWRELQQSAEGALNRAEKIAAPDRELLSAELGERLATVAGQLQTDERDRQVAVELDRIRLGASTPVNGHINIAQGKPKLYAAFLGAGYDLQKESPRQVAERIKDSAIRFPLVAGIDFLAMSTRDRSERTRLLEVARLADPDPWRDGFRETDVWDAPMTLQGLAEQVDCARQSPQILAALAQQLSLQNRDAEAVALLRRALVDHPRDFWLLYELGIYSKDPPEQIGAFRTTLAVRPSSPLAYFSLGVVQYGNQQLDLAIASYRKAVELDPSYAGAQLNLGLALSDQGKIEEAMVYYRRVLEIDPNSPLALINLGAAFFAQNKVDEAADCYRKAIEIDPRSEAAHNNLGTALRSQLKLDQAIVSFKTTLDINPKHAMAWCNLGHTLRQQGKLGEALVALKKGHEFGSQQKGWSYPSAQWVQETEQLIALEQKLPAVLKGETTPADAREYVALAELCVMYKKQFAAAARFYAAGFAAEPALGADLSFRRRYNASCAAVLAAGGQGLDAGQLTATERDGLRKQALAWLSADLAAWRDVLHKTPQRAASVEQTLAHWQSDPDLAGIRDETSLAKLPPEEQTTCRQLWAEVAALRARAGRGGKE